MTKETRIKLEQKLNEHGLTVLLTKDFASILLQLARLAQFERMVETTYGDVPYAREALQHIRQQQNDQIEDDGNSRPLEVIDIPTVMNQVNRALHDQLDKKASIDLLRVNAAVLAFVGILCAEVR